MRKTLQEPKTQVKGFFILLGLFWGGSPSTKHRHPSARSEDRSEDRSKKRSACHKLDRSWVRV